MEGLIEPIIDRLLQHKEMIDTIKKDNKKTNDQLTNLREMVFKTDGKLDVFEEIHLRITDAVASVKLVEENFVNDRLNLNTRMD